MQHVQESVSLSSTCSSRFKELHISGSSVCVTFRLWRPAMKISAEIKVIRLYFICLLSLNSYKGDPAEVRKFPLIYILNCFLQHRLWLPNESSNIAGFPFFLPSKLPTWAEWLGVGWHRKLICPFIFQVTCNFLGDPRMLLRFTKNVRNF